ncbi:WD40 repeat domain-containing protein [Acaryochloris sp. 'Moss Beach']|uniref:WD40 repeat domain-containing protein n=1 Tax=Acaryochloris sp. 'Moss Beach' TaxID=2740837 RepID=UPI001F41A6DB|nr:hypothetical protein [Acaryochloris sp. 'Moss Beach']
MVEGGSLLTTLEGHTNRVRALAYSPDGSTLATASDNNTVKLWSKEGSLLTTLEGHTDWVRALAYSPDGSTLATASSDNTVKLWSKEGSLLTTLEGHTDVVRVLAYSPDGSTLATASYDKTVKLWSKEGSLLTTLEGHTNRVNALAYSPDGSTLATASSDKTVKLWSKEGSLLTTLEGHTDVVWALAYSPDGSTLATASSDKTVKLWSKEGSLLTTLEGHTNRVNALAYSPDGSTLATASSDKTVKLWSKEGSLLTTLEGHTDVVWALAYSPDGSTLATASSDKTVKLWSKEGSLLTTLEGHTDWVRALAYSPDGSTLATASYDNTVKLWSKEGSLLTTLEGHTGVVWALAYSPDGSTLATASDDKTVKLWSKEGSLLTTLEGHTAWVNALAYSPDGSTLATASYDKTVKLWNFKLENLVDRGCKWLSGYFIRYPQELEPLRVCHSPSLLSSVAPSLVKQGQALAEAGNMDKARQKFQTALNWSSKLDFEPQTQGINQDIDALVNKYGAIGKAAKGKQLAKAGKSDQAFAEFQTALLLNPTIDLDPSTEVKEQDPQKLIVKWAAPAKLEKAQKLAKAGKSDQAFAEFQTALLLNPTIDLDPSTEVKEQDPQKLIVKWAAPAKLEKAQQLVKQGKVSDAVTIFREVNHQQKLDPTIEISAYTWNSLCWAGSLQRKAKAVMFACEKAVAFDPSHGGRRNSRGLARALTNNFKGAVEDFEAYIKWSDISTDQKTQRQSWINDLKTGKDPFTDEVLESLSDE